MYYSSTVKHETVVCTSWKYIHVVAFMTNTNFITDGSASSMFRTKCSVILHLLYFQVARP